MYFQKPQTSDSVDIEKSNTWVIIATSVLTLAFGIAPGLIAEMFKF
jgi:NADH:ubiquinone oxidoreductase subunit 2 (subunit N)